MRAWLHEHPSRVVSPVCDKCGDYLPGHATGGSDICTCPAAPKSFDYSGMIFAGIAVLPFIVFFLFYCLDEVGDWIRFIG